MGIWLALLIPVITAFVLYFFFSRKTIWWEFAIPFAVSLVLVLIMKFSTELSQTSDTEYLSETAGKAIYSEPWDEEVPCRHPIYCTEYYECGDSKQSRTCSREYVCGHEHSYDVDYHPAYWQLVSTSGNYVNITQAKYNYFFGKWKNKSKYDKHRDFHSIDGDWYIVNWPGVDDMIECMVTTESYENRVQASSSVFNYPEVTEKDKQFYELYEYPDITEGYKQKSILGYGDSTQKRAEHKLEILNAKLGPKKQVKVFILLFRNKSEDVAFQQECYWKGGNKNEFIVCIGVDNLNKVKWCRPFSFTESQITKVETRNFVQGMDKINLASISDFLYKEMDKNFKRKQFKEFSYLSIEPKGWQVILTFILTITLNVCLTLWIIKNEFDDNDSSKNKY